MFSKFKKWLNPERPPPNIVKDHSLYYFDSCPFCRVVLSEIKRLNLDIELRNIHQDESHRKDLIDGGGKKTVPCLRIENAGASQWMYESMDIVKYLRVEFSN